MEKGGWDIPHASKGVCMIKWIKHSGFEEANGIDCTITIEPRPPYCDRGNFVAKVFERNSLFIDGQDG